MRIYIFVLEKITGVTMLNKIGKISQLNFNVFLKI